MKVVNERLTSLTDEMQRLDWSLSRKVTQDIKTQPQINHYRRSSLHSPVVLVSYPSPIVSRTPPGRNERRTGRRGNGRKTREQGGYGYCLVDLSMPFRNLTTLGLFRLLSALRVVLRPPYVPSFILSLLHHTLRRPKGGRAPEDEGRRKRDRTEGMTEGRE